MNNDAIWRAFARTGDPVYYLLYKTTSGEQETGKNGKRPGQQPRPGN